MHISHYLLQFFIYYNLMAYKQTYSLHEWAGPKCPLIVTLIEFNQKENAVPV